jgi:hypothetical protein
VEESNGVFRVLNKAATIHRDHLPLCKLSWQDWEIERFRDLLQALAEGLSTSTTDIARLIVPHRADCPNSSNSSDSAGSDMPTPSGHLSADKEAASSCPASGERSSLSDETEPVAQNANISEQVSQPFAALAQQTVLGDASASGDGSTGNPSGCPGGKSTSKQKKRAHCELDTRCLRDPGEGKSHLVQKLLSLPVRCYLCDRNAERTQGITY